MHKGHRYPFHPFFFSTEAWFWPGYVPWKMRLNVIGSPGPPWDALVDAQVVFSEAGIPSTGFQVIEYHFWLPQPPDLVSEAYLRMFKDEIDGVKYAVWEFSLFDGTSRYPTAWYFDSFPQRVVQRSGNPWWMTYDPLSIPTGPNFQFRPANYAEGGSPWPHG